MLSSLVTRFVSLHLDTHGAHRFVYFFGSDYGCVDRPVTQPSRDTSEEAQSPLEGVMVGQTEPLSVQMNE